MHDKIKKLMAMAAHPNSNPNEAANAAAMAARLATQHNIDVSELQDKPAFNVFWCDWTFPPRDDQGMFSLSNAVARTYGCKTLIRKSGSAHEMAFVGRPHNAELAKSWLDYLWRSCKQANTEYARSKDFGSSSLREQARSTFRFGFSRTVAVRLLEELEKMKTEGLPETGSTALVVGAWFEQERKEVEAYMSTELTLRATKGRQVKGLQEAYSAGVDSGKRVSLRKQVT